MDRLSVVDNRVSNCPEMGNPELRANHQKGADEWD